jgi:hypothetical protein
LTAQIQIWHVKSELHDNKLETPRDVRAFNFLRDNVYSDEEEEECKDDQKSPVSRFKCCPELLEKYRNRGVFVKVQLDVAQDKQKQ